MEWAAAAATLLGIILWLLKSKRGPTKVEKAHKIATKARANVSKMRDALARKDEETLANEMDRQDALLDAMFSVRDKKPKD